MELGLVGKIALVTGASKGLGRAIALELGREGVRLTICSRQRAELQEAAAEIQRTGAQVLAIEADITQPDQVQALLKRAGEQYGALDILVNNAGRAQPGKFQSLSDEEWQQDYTVKVLGQVRMVRAALPLLRRSRSPCIININAVSGRIAAPGLMATSAHRAACLALNKNLAVELAPEGIRVNSVNIGYITTPQWEHIRQRLAPEQSPEEFQKGMAQRHIPLGRFGRPEEAAGIVAFLASHRASYITGASIDVGGGMGAHI